MAHIWYHTNKCLTKKQLEYVSSTFYYQHSRIRLHDLRINQTGKILNGHE